MRAQRHLRLRETREEQSCEGSAANPGLQWRLRKGKRPPKTMKTTEFTNLFLAVYNPAKVIIRLTPTTRQLTDAEMDQRAAA